jgi:hypothetical protein
MRASAAHAAGMPATENTGTGAGQARLLPDVFVQPGVVTAWVIGIIGAVPLGGEEGTCPVGALRRWLAVAAIGEGRVFRRIDRYGNLGPGFVRSGAGGDGGGPCRCRWSRG